jgi:4-hydroxyproline epimerase
MCGHGTIGTVTMAIENGLVKPKTPGVLRPDTPAGLVIAEYRQEGEYVEEVRITNVPAFLYAEDLTVDCPDTGRNRWTSPMAAISTLSLSLRTTIPIWRITPPAT